MSFVREALRDLPQLLCLMDDGTPYLDYSGYGRVVTSTGGVTPHYGFVSGADTLPVLITSTNVTYADVPVWRTGYEKKDFTLEAWVRIAATTYGEQQVLGNSGQYDGILINGTIVSFVVPFTNSTARIDYDMQRRQVAHIVAVYTPSRISLYINGELVGEQELTAAQQSESFLNTSTSLHSGKVAVAQRIAIGGVAAYASALDATRILRHYLVGRDVPRPVDVVSAWDGEYVHATVNDFDNFLDFTWETSEDWNDAELHSVTVEDGSLVPEFSGDVSLPGKWYDSIPLEISAAATIYGVIFDWEGEGVVVEGSVTGTTWEVLQKGIRPGFSRLISPINKSVQIRVSFPGGITNDDAYISRLRAVGISSAVSKKIGDRTITLTGAHPQFHFDERDLNQDEGILLNIAADTMIISANTAPDAAPVRSVAIMWARTGGTAPTVSAASATITNVGLAATYENGVTGDGIGVTGSYTLSHFIYSDAIAEVTITAQAQVAWVAFFEESLTAEQVKEMYLSLTGKRIIAMDDSDALAIPESDTAYKIYAHDWSILASG